MRHPPTAPNSGEIEDPNGIFRVISRVVRDPPNVRSASGPAEDVSFPRVLDRSGPRFPKLCGSWILVINFDIFGVIAVIFCIL